MCRERNLAQDSYVFCARTRRSNHAILAATIMTTRLETSMIDKRTKIFKICFNYNKYFVESLIGQQTINYVNYNLTFCFLLNSSSTFACCIRSWYFFKPRF